MVLITLPRLGRQADDFLRLGWYTFGMPNDLNLKRVFNDVVSLYDETRPHYPEKLFNELIKVVHLSDDAKLLEIGPGTGQATKPMAELGFPITAVEFGKDLAEAAKENLKEYPNVKIIHGAFEEANLPKGAFDLVYSATAFHWLEPEIKFTKTHNLLKPKGYLAIIHTNTISDEEGDIFFKATQPIYDKYGLTSSGNGKFQLPKISNLKSVEVDENLFEQTLFKVFPVTIRRKAEDYIKLLSTFSSNRALPEQAREKFFNEIRELINVKFNGEATKRYGMSLTIARKT